MKPRLQSQIDDLYKLPLDEFTNARNALAKSLSGSEKKAIGSLVKPSLPMWVINQLYWQDAPTYKALVDASEKLRAAHRSALTGPNVDTRKPDELHKATVGKAFARAVTDAQKKGIRLTDTVRDAVRRTLAALPTDEPAGRITREPPAAGFSLFTGVKPRPIEQAKKTSASAPEPSGEERRRQRLAEKKAERERREAERIARAAAEKARKERKKREREIEKAEQAVREAERRLAELKR